MPEEYCNPKNPLCEDACYNPKSCDARKNYYKCQIGHINYSENPFLWDRTINPKNPVGDLK